MNDDIYPPSEYNVYLLKHTIHRGTYLGITNNLKRRIRQHNGEIKGGARSTSRRKGNGEWIYHLIVPNLTKSEALSLERLLKIHRRKGKGRTPLDRRVDLIEKFGFHYDLMDEEDEE
jgi:structure-specific endonuclease subunit SLX1